jgi:transposase
MLERGITTMTLLGRELTRSEREELEHLARSRAEEARLVERAGIVLAAAREKGMMAVSRALRKDKHTIRTWVERYLAGGIAGLHDLPRCGAPCEYTPEQKAAVIQAALTHPQDLDLPFAHWTHDRLTAYMHEVKHIPISRTRIAEILRAEGLRWHHDESWYGERLDPAFAEKRGRWSGHTGNTTSTRSPSVSTRWVP